MKNYEIIKFQNTSSFSYETPTIVIENSHPLWNDFFQNWIQGKNPNNDEKWKIGVFAVFQLKNNVEPLNV